MSNSVEKIALYCPELQELMIDSGRSFRVPDQIAATVDPKAANTRFVKAWAAIHKLIPADCDVSIFVDQLEEVA